MNQPAQPPYEEIDLIDLLIKIYKFLKKRYKMILGVSLLFALVGFFISFLLIKPRFQSSMIVYSRSLSASETIGLINDLKELSKENNVAELSRLLSVDEDTADDFFSIWAVPNRELQQNTERDLRKDSTIAITIELLSNKQWEPFEKGIIFYLQNNPYTKKKNTIFIKSQQILLKNVQKEIKRIDSLKSIIEASTTNKNTLILSASGGIHNESVQLYEKESKIKESLSFSNDIEVVKSFTKFKKPKKHPIHNTVIICAFVGFIVGLLWAMLIELNKLLRVRESLKL